MNKTIETFMALFSIIGAILLFTMLLDYMRPQYEEVEAIYHFEYNKDLRGSKYCQIIEIRDEMDITEEEYYLCEEDDNRFCRIEFFCGKLFDGCVDGRYYEIKKSNSKICYRKYNKLIKEAWSFK